MSDQLTNYSAEPAKIDVTGVSEDLADLAREEFEKITDEGQKPLNNIKIGISISESEEIEILGLSDIHQKDYMIEVARHLLVQGATLIYGGDLRNGGYTKLLSELSLQYRNRKDRTQFPLKNYFSFPSHLRLDNVALTEFKKSRVDIIKVPPSPELGIRDDVFVKSNSDQGKYIWVRSLSYMRKEMNDDSNARIFIGGRNFNYAGIYPGVVEEAYYAFNSKIPCYLVGAFGGATLNIINALSKISFVLDKNAPYFQLGAHKDFFTNYNEKAPDNQIDFDKLNTFFEGLSIEWLSEQNGLSVEDNKRLFTTIHFQEIIYLILKGLKSKFPYS